MCSKNSLYRWDEIKIAEQFNPEGNTMHKKLGQEFDEEYRQYNSSVMDLHD